MSCPFDGKLTEYDDSCDIIREMILEGADIMELIPRRDVLERGNDAAASARFR